MVRAPVVPFTHRPALTLAHRSRARPHRGTTLMVLDISFNEIQSVPEGIGELSLLRCVGWRWEWALLSHSRS